MIITQSNIPTHYYYQNKRMNDQISDVCITLNSNDNSSHGNLSQVIQKTIEIIESLVISDEQIINKENDLSKIVGEVVTFIFKGLNEGKFHMSDEKLVLDFLNNQDITSHVIYNCLSNNQSNSNSIFFYSDILIFLELRQVKIMKKRSLYLLVLQNNIIY